MTALKDTLKVAEDAQHEAWTRGGGTFNLAVGCPNPKSGYAVGLARYGGVVEDNTNALFEIEEYLNKHKYVLAQPGHFFGIWLDGGYLILDVVKVLPEKAAAEELARSEDQDAYANLATGEVHYLR